ncbi:MAG: hypothetical protein HYY60_01830 [Parcubacteria group bacterium]|nr:hypothetical protein [Parcubacteria group bacterium]MBI3074617.1 hypothetical protein [Parcubacteria group bacterium]
MNKNTTTKTTKVRGMSSLLQKKHENKWVAFSSDYKRIVSSGETLKDTASKIGIKDREGVVFYKVLPFGSYYEPLLL